MNVKKIQILLEATKEFGKKENVIRFLLKYQNSGNKEYMLEHEKNIITKECLHQSIRDILQETKVLCGKNGSKYEIKRITLRNKRYAEAIKETFKYLRCSNNIGKNFIEAITKALNPNNRKIKDLSPMWKAGNSIENPALRAFFYHYTIMLETNFNSDEAVFSRLVMNYILVSNGYRWTLPTKSMYEFTFFGKIDTEDDLKEKYIKFLVYMFAMIEEEGMTKNL